MMDHQSPTPASTAAAPSAAATVPATTTVEAPVAPEASTAPRIRQAGQAPIKPECLKPLSVLLARKDAKSSDKPTANDTPEPAANDQATTVKAQDKGAEQEDESSRGKKQRGTFKKRPIDEAEDPSQLLCRPVAAGEVCRFGDSCKFSHDTKDFMKRKPKDLGAVCPVFEALGHCRYGLACRYASSHLVTHADGSITNVPPPKSETTLSSSSTGDDDEDANAHETNALTNDVRVLLRKNQYTFRSLEQLKKGGQRHHRKNRNEEAQARAAAEGAATAGEATGGSSEAPAAVSTSADSTPVVEMNDDNRPLLAERKPVDFHRKIYIAPLTTVGNLPFRRLLKQTGADITCGEMAMGTNLLRAQQSEWALLRRHKSEDVFGVQIAGGHGDQVARVCELLTRETDVDFIDINMGCPIDLVCKAGSGAALMNHAPRLTRVIAGALTGIELGGWERNTRPGLTVKLRTGWSDKHPVAHKLMAKIQATRASQEFMSASVVQIYQLRATQAVDGITVHGRSRLQRYTRNADWDYVFQCQQAQSSELPSIPVIGGGDVLSFEEFDEHLKNGQLETCMLARGALIKPWLPIEIKERRHFDISASERLDLLKDFVKFGLEHWGSDQKGVNRTRRYLLEWQSFLCRYIPVGLLEVLPQRINDRPSPYYGRNDLESLMGSDQAVDWIKISELLLGPVPPGFQFVPKHKANSYG